MRAIVQTAYGDVEVLKLTEVPQPVPAPDEVLVKVRAASMHADVWHVMTGLPYVLRLMGAGLRRPKQPIPGTDMAGVVEAVGAQVTRFKVGDEVFGETLRSMQWNNGGSFAEYVACPVAALALKPSNVSFESAAAVPTSGLIALNNLRETGRLKAGQQVLINGAGGGVGTLALQIAKAMGGQVTAVDHTAKLGLLKELGADQVIDYTTTDFTQGSERYDLIFDIHGFHPLAAYKRVLKPTGLYVLIGHDNYGKDMRRWFGAVPTMLGMMVKALLYDKQLPAGLEMINRTEGMEVLRGLLESGQLTPAVDRTFGLEEVPEAMRQMMAGGLKGKAVIVL